VGGLSGKRTISFSIMNIYLAGTKWSRNRAAFLDKFALKSIQRNDVVPEDNGNTEFEIIYVLICVYAWMD